MTNSGLRASVHAPRCAPAGTAVRCLAGILFLLSCATAATAQGVAIVVDGQMPAPAQHGLSKLEAALTARGLTVRADVDAVAASTFVILAGIRAANGPAAAALTSMHVALPDGPESLVIRRGATFKGKRALVLVGGGAIGLMYAALDAADRVAWAASDAGRVDPFTSVRDIAESPYLKTRAVSMYTMNRAYWESKLYDETYWRTYFDMLAANRFNQFTIQFGYDTGGFMAPMYPYFFDTPGWPNVRMTGMTAAMQAKNLVALKAIVRLAHERGLRLFLGGWDHIDRGVTVGAEGQRFGRVNVPGGEDQLVRGLDQNNLAAYTKAAIAKLAEVVPDVDGYQWRMLDEAGIPNSIQVPFWEDVFRTVMRLGKVTEMRAKGVDPRIYEDSHAMALDFLVNTKVWMEQVGMPFHPMHINRQDQMNVRHGYADLLKYPQTYRMQWQLWTGGTTRLLLWGDPEYTRRLAMSARIYDSDALEINEILATKMYGEPHTAMPLPIHSAPYRTYRYEFERYWHYYRVWGRLTYNPATESDVWQHEFVARFGPQAGPHVERALERASQVLPRVVAASYPYRGFPTIVGWAEMQRLGSLSQYAAQEEGSDIQLFENVRDAATRLLGGRDTPMVRVEDTSRWFASTSSAILSELGQAQRQLGAAASGEFKATAADLGILAGLARYHSERLLGGLEYNLYKQGGDLTAFDRAIAHERLAVRAWSDMVAAAGDVYSPELPFGLRGRFPRHWSEELDLLKKDFDALLVERQSATGKADAKVILIPAAVPGTPPVAVVSRPTLAEQGHDLTVKANVTARAGVKSVLLRYRHLNQTEDYQTANMVLDARTGAYSGTVPASFIDPKWNLMYFVEVIDARGTGRMFPDFETEQPYVVVPVKR